jgi:hypothetical protein
MDASFPILPVARHGTRRKPLVDKSSRTRERVVERFAHIALHVVYEEVDVFGRHAASFQRSACRRSR